MDTRTELCIRGSSGSRLAPYCVPMSIHYSTWHHISSGILCVLVLHCVLPGGSAVGLPQPLVEADFGQTCASRPWRRNVVSQVRGHSSPCVVLWSLNLQNTTCDLGVPANSCVVPWNVHHSDVVEEPLGTILRRLWCTTVLSWWCAGTLVRREVVIDSAYMFVWTTDS